MLYYFILFLIILAIIIWGAVTKWKFIKRKRKDGYDNKKKLTIYFPYYNRPDYLQKQLENYSKMSPEIKDKITLFIVDDGSMKSPAVDVIKNFKGKLHIILYRINIDIPWNAAEANNLAFSKVQTDYVFRTDIDIMFLEDDLNKLFNIDLKKGIFYTFNRRHPDCKKSIGSPPNIYLIHKDDYWKTNGYNEYFSGSYGDDIEFLPRLNKKVKKKYINYIYCIQFHGAGTPPEANLDRSLKINTAKLNEKNTPHLIFQHKDKYQFLKELNLK